MFDKIGRLAEAAADSISVSRRGFIGRLGRGAMAVGALFAGFSAAAGKSGAVCCIYRCRLGGRVGSYHYSSKYKCQPAGTTCATFLSDCGLWQQFTVTDCTNCGK
jgi:hypothetical protein